jgi:hypothetical protein
MTELPAGVGSGGFDNGIYIVYTAEVLEVYTAEVLEGNPGAVTRPMGAGKDAP